MCPFVCLVCVTEMCQCSLWLSVKIREKSKTDHSFQHLPHVGDEECGSGNEKVVHSVKLLSHGLGVDGVVRHIPTGQGYYLHRTHPAQILAMHSLNSISFLCIQTQKRISDTDSLLPHSLLLSKLEFCNCLFSKQKLQFLQRKKKEKTIICLEQFLLKI